MKLFGFGLFQPSSLKDYVMKIVGGTVVAQGIGKTFLVTPRARFISVPTADRMISFSSVELTSDTQLLNVQGMLSVTLLPDDATKQNDFTIDLSKKGAYIDPNVIPQLQSKVVKLVQLIARSQVQEKTLKDHIADVSALATSLEKAVATKRAEFRDLGVEVKRVFIDKVSPNNHDISAALEAMEREKLLTNADQAVAERRMQSAKDERALREYEAETAKNMEEKRAALIEAQNANLLKKADAEAEAKKKELGAYGDMPAGTIFALAMTEFARTGRVGTLNITPDMLEAIRSATDKAPNRSRN